MSSSDVEMWEMSATDGQCVVTFDPALYNAMRDDRDSVGVHAAPMFTIKLCEVPWDEDSMYSFRGYDMDAEPAVY
jgi:hypothetical protein